MLFITGGVGACLQEHRPPAWRCLLPLPLPAQAEFAERPPGIHEMRNYALVTRHGGAWGGVVVGGGW